MPIEHGVEIELNFVVERGKKQIIIISIRESRQASKAGLGAVKFGLRAHIL